MAQRTRCSFSGCGRSRYAEGMCWHHLSIVRSRRGDLCGESGCENPRFAGDVCSTHHRNRYRVDRPCMECGAMRRVDPNLPGRERCGRCSRRRVSPLGVAARSDFVCRDLVGPVEPRRSGWKRHIEARQRLAESATPSMPGQWRKLFVAGDCPWCGEYFIRGATSWDTRPKYCSVRCRERSAKSARGRFVVPDCVRLAVYERDGWVCQLCEEPVDKDLPPSDMWAATLDHIVPRSKGGSDDADNLRLAHRWCNSVRGDETYYDESVLKAG